MVAYGPWVQDADYVPTWGVNTNDPDDYVQEIQGGGGETGFQDPAYPITSEDLTTAFNNAQDLLDNRGGWVEWLSSTYNLSFPNWKSSWSTQIWARVFPVANREHLYNPPNHGSLPPESAIGIDYANQPYDPDDPWGWAAAENLALRLATTTEFEGQFEDDRVAPGAALPWGVTTRLVMSVNGGEVREDLAFLSSPENDSANNWVLCNLDGPIDLTPYGAIEAGWTATLHTETHTPVIGGSTAPHNDTFTEYGWLINELRFEADVRPPLYRWVYEGGVSYRRNYPRDDGLAGGARRNYPPSRATQSGNRNVGGYL